MGSHDWIDITTAGSRYEIQFKPATREQRYRPLTIARMDNPAYDERPAGEWTLGDPPHER